jgi:hypothetical protein
VPRLYNDSVFVADIRLVQRSTESRTHETGDKIGKLSRVLEGRHSKTIEEEMTGRLHSDLK